LAARPRPGPRVEFFVDARGPVPEGAIPGTSAGPRDIDVAAPAPRQYPIVEPDAATFVWQGEADSVWLRHFMALEVAGFPFTREPDSDWWRLRLQVPERARFEYKFDIVRNGHGEWINDPLNPRLATDPFGANSVCETWAYAAPEWATPGLAQAVGSIEHWMVKSPSFHGRREIGVYLPAGYDDSRSYPLVIVHDGYDYVDHAALKSILDNLIERGDLPPLIAALTQSPDRKVEYVDDPRHVSYVTRELLPALEHRYNLSSAAHNRVLMGASLGAVASLSIAARAPQQFGGVVLKSGSFIFNQDLLATRHELFQRVSDFIDSLSDYERLLHRAFVSCGRYEGLVEENRRMAAFLRHAGVATRYAESRDAHHWGNWRDQTRAGLMWCLQPSMSRQPPAAKNT
jgi:enterochelin esterase family protein